MKTKLITLATIITFAASSAFALDLASARASGAVGELPTGYVAAINNDKATTDLVATVNAKRKAEYARISGENGQSVDVVAKLAHPQIVENLPKGAPYQDVKGNWLKK